MAISYTTEVRDIVQESFNLLRQDFSAPEVAQTPVTIDEVTDTSLEWSKARLALKTAANEVFDAHGWSGSVTADGIGTWPYRMRNALVYCIARELSIPIAGRIEDMKAFDALYRDKIQQAMLADMEVEKAAVTDPDTKRLIAMITMDFRSMGTIPHSFAALLGRITDIASSARQEVLLAHPWRFAEVEESASSETCEGRHDLYRFATPYPKCLRLISVFGHTGKLCEWKIENGYILSIAPIVGVKFVKDIADVSRWPAVVHNVYIHRLAADVARTVMGNAQDAQMQEALYRQALQDAKLRDSAESNTPTDAWGENFYVRQMKGGRDHRFGRAIDPVLKVVPFPHYGE